MIIAPKSVTLKNNLEVIFRSPNKEDAQSMLNHLKIVFHESYRNMNHGKTQWDHFPLEDQQKHLESFASGRGNFILAAFSGDRIIGNLSFFGMGADHVKHNGRLAMSLEKEFHGLGLGKALLEYCMAKAKELKFHRLELTVRTFNLAGIALYERVGFQKVGLLKDAAFIDGEYHDEFIYERILK